VNDPLLVEVGQRRGDVAPESNGVVYAEGPALAQEVIERAPGEELRDLKDHPSGLASVEDGDEVGVVESRGPDNLATKTTTDLFGVPQVGTQRLEGHLPRMHPVAGPVHLHGRPRPHQLGDEVATHHQLFRCVDGLTHGCPYGSS
jgi:hypothetical protein